MKRIKAFFYVYFKSVTSPSYYADVLKTKFSFSVKYYLLLALLASLVATTITTVTLVPTVNKQISSFVNEAKNYYPNDLVFTIKNNEWTVNKPQPVLFAFPKIDSQQESAPSNLIVFYSEGTINDLDNLNTLILINKVNVIYKENGSIKITPIQNLPDMTFAKTDFSTFVNQVSSVTKVLPFLIFVIVLTGNMIFYILFKGVHLLFLGILIWLITKVSKFETGFWGAYRIGLHTMTLPLTLELILTAVKIEVPLSSWFFLLNAAIAIFVIARLSKTTEKKTV